MKCDICLKNKATIHIQEVFDKDLLEERHLCGECAKEALKFEDFMSLENKNMEALMIKKEKIYKKSVKTKLKNHVCVSCGTSLKRFTKTRNLGCEKCYEEFSLSLNEYLKYIRHGTRHIGKSPALEKKSISMKQKKFELEKELSRLLQTEDYENAAIIRDSIAQLKNTLF